MTKYSALSSNDPSSAIMAFCTAIMHGDTKGITEAHVDTDVVIINTVAPFIWSGPTAVADWMASMTLYVEDRGITDGSVVYEAPITHVVDGDVAHTVVPAIWSYRERGIPMRNAATIAFALRNTWAGWRIAGWSWNPSN